MDIAMKTINRPIYTQRPFEQQIQENLGEYGRFLVPGLGFQIPLIQPIRARNIHEYAMDINPQPATTEDNVEVQVVGVMWVDPAMDEESINRTFYNIDDWKRTITQLAMTNLRQERGGYLTPEESRVAGEMIATILQKILDSFAAELGPPQR